MFEAEERERFESEVEVSIVADEKTCFKDEHKKNSRPEEKYRSEMKHYDAFEAERIDRIVDQENLRAEIVEGGV